MEFARDKQRSKSRRRVSRSGRRSSSESQLLSAESEKSAILAFLSGGNSPADAAITWLLIATGVCTTLVFGGRTAAGQATFLVCSLITAATFFCVASYRGTRVRPTWIDIPIVLGLLLIAFQLIPLPQSLLERISPAQASLFPARHTEEIALSQWETLSLAPRETFCQLGLVLSGWLLTLVARHHIRSRVQIAAFLDVLSICTALLAAFAVAQFAFGNGKFFWVYTHPFATTNYAANGSFTNPNHFGEFVALIIAWPVWRVLRHEADQSSEGESPTGRTQLILAIACLALMLPAVLLSLSRNAMGSCGVSVGLTTLAAYIFAKKEFKAQIRMRVTIATTVIVAVAALSLVAMGEKAELQVDRNFAELTSSDVETLDWGGTRRKIWTTVLRGASDFPAVGVGLGAHASTYDRYWEGPELEATFTHAENGPLQLLFETGLTGIILLGCTLLLVVVRLGKYLFQSDFEHQHKPIAAVALVVIATSCCQSLADFSWYVPAVAGTVAVIVSIAVGAAGPQLSKYGPRIIPIVGLLVSVGALATFTPRAMQAAQAEAHWYAYLKTTQSGDASVPVKLIAAQNLIRTLKCDPTHPEANEAMARMYLWMFDLGQERSQRFQLTELRDAVQGAGWEDRDAYEAWLRDDSVAGDMVDLLAQARQHAITAYNQRPLDVETTIILLHTNFLDSFTDNADAAYYAQLRQIAPENPLALLERCSEAFRKDEIEKGLSLMAHAYRNGPKLRKTLLKDFAKLTPANDLLERLELPGSDLVNAAHAYREQGKLLDADHLQRMAAVKFENRSQTETSLTEKFWWLDKAVTAYRALDENLHAAELAQMRVDIDPSDVKARSTLGDILVELQRWPEAIQHYEHCAASSGEPKRWDSKLARCRKMVTDRQSIMIQASGQLPMPQ